MLQQERKLILNYTKNTSRDGVKKLRDTPAGIAYFIDRDVATFICCRLFCTSVGDSQWILCSFLEYMGGKSIGLILPKIMFRLKFIIDFCDVFLFANDHWK